MKRTVIFSFFLLSVSILFAQKLNHIALDSRGNKMLLGQVNKNGLSQSPFNEWYSKQFNNYHLNDQVVSSLKDSISDYKIKVFFGSWCGDSKRELPHFYKILEAANFPDSQLEIVGVARSGDDYKQAPNGEEKGLNIHRVPTFIFYKDGKEVNRIVERPVETLERDVHKIIIENKYTPNYNVVNRLNNLITEKSIDSLRFEEATLVPKLSEFVRGSRELNTFGYVLLRSNQIEKALYVFDFNTKLFPYKSNVYDSLGEAYYETKNYTKALKNYYKVLSLNPEDKNAKDMIAKIELLNK